MRLTSTDGANVELRPTRYRFPAEPPDPRFDIPIGDQDCDSFLLATLRLLVSFQPCIEFLQSLVDIPLVGIDHN